MAERIGVGMGKKGEREPKRDNWSKKKRGGPVTCTTGRGGHGQGAINYV